MCTQNANVYYTFAYVYGNNNVLLITEIEEITIPANKHVSLEVQLYNFVRDNNVKFKRFVHSHYSRQITYFNKPENNLLCEEQKEKLLAEWNKKIDANKGNVIFIKEFVFDKLIKNQSLQKENTTEIK
jgi:hypothetical protein